MNTVTLHYVNQIRLIDAIPDIVAVIKAIPGSKLYYNGCRMVVSCAPNPRWIKLRIGEVKNETIS
jgi:hypothetical protein